MNMHVSLACWPQCSDVEVVRHAAIISWPAGLMDKASASGAGDSRLKSWAGHDHAAHARQRAAASASLLSHPSCPHAGGRHDHGS